MSRRGIDMRVPPSALSNVEWRPLEGLFLSSRNVSFFFHSRVKKTKYFVEILVTFEILC